VPLVLLAVEACLLTPFVEFDDSQIALLANPLVGFGAVFGLTIFVYLVCLRNDAPLDRVTSLGRSLTWASIHLLAFILLFILSLRLVQLGADRWVVTGTWCVLALIVGATAMLLTMRASAWFKLILRNRWQAVIASVLAASWVLLTPSVRELWPRVCGPAIKINSVLLDQFPGKAVTGIRPDGLPVVGTRKLQILVTSSCSELESVFGFCLFGGLILVCGGHRLNRAKFAVFLLLGFCVFYVLLAIRLYGLVLFGLAHSPQGCVALAHSRVGSVAFLGVTVLYCTVAYRWARRPVVAGDAA